MNIELDVYRTYHISGPILTTITMNDLVEDSFSHHSSVCDDSTFHFGGMSSASIKFETTKLTYGDNNTKIPWKYVNFLVKSYTEDGQGNRTYKYLGVFFTQGVTEKANHSRVEITAYDIMWLLRGKDDTAWYNNFVSEHSSDITLSTFMNAFWIRISNDIRQVWHHGNVAGGTSIDPNTVYDDTGIYWRPDVLDDKGNSTPLLSGIIYAGKILKDFCEAFGYNVYADFRYSTSVSQYIRLRVRDVSTLLSGQNVKTLSPTQYCDMEYETNDVSLFTNVQVQALNKIYNASSTITRNYGISNNIFTNLGTQYYEEVSGDLEDENVLHAQRLLANLQNFVYRPCTFTTYEDLFDLTDQVDVTLPDGTTFRTFIMQKDIKGIGGAKYIYTCLPMENYNDDAGYTDYYDGSTSFSVDDTYPTVTEATSRTNLSVGDSFKTIIGKIKKFFADLKTVAFTGSYNDLSDQPTSLPASDVYPWAKAATKPSYSASDVGALASNSTGFTPPSPRDFANGTLITTDIDYSQREGAAFLLVIFADGYGNGRYLTLANGYIYNNTIINYGVTNMSTRIGSIIAQNVGGKLCFWFARQAYWQSFGCICYASSSGNYSTNHVVSVTNSADPNGTKRVDLCTNILNSAFTSEIPSSADFVVKSGATNQRIEGNDTPITLYRSNAAGSTYIGFRNTAAMLGYFGVDTNKKPIFEPSGSGDYEIALVKDVWLHKQFHVSQTGATIGYVLIQINNQSDWMLSFHVRLYGQYIADDYIISGYNYTSQTGWFGPTVMLQSTDGASRPVYFGYTSMNSLWVAIPNRQYTGCDIVDCVNGYVQVDMAGLFTMSIVGSLPATLQQTITAYPPWRKNESISWSGGQISNSGIAYANANNEIGWIAGFGSQGYLKLTGGRTSGKTGLLDVVADTWVLEGANNTSGYNKWLYHGKLASNRFQCGTLAFSAAGSNSVTFSGAFGGTPIVSLTVQGNSNVYVRTYSLSASAMYITVSGACTVHWMAYYNA